MFRTAQSENLSDRYLNTVTDVIGLAWMLAVSSDPLIFSIHKRAGEETTGSRDNELVAEKIVSQAHRDR